MTTTDKASMSYPSARSAFFDALDQLEASAAELQAAAQREHPKDTAHALARNVASNLTTARVGNVTSLGELRRMLADEPTV